MSDSASRQLSLETKLDLIRSNCRDDSQVKEYLSKNKQVIEGLFGAADQLIDTMVSSAVTPSQQQEGNAGDEYQPFSSRALETLFAIRKDCQLGAREKLYGLWTKITKDLVPAFSRRYWQLLGKVNNSNQGSSGQQQQQLLVVQSLALQLFEDLFADIQATIGWHLSQRGKSPAEGKLLFEEASSGSVFPVLAFEPNTKNKGPSLVRLINCSYTLLGQAISPTAASGSSNMNSTATDTGRFIAAAGLAPRLVLLFRDCDIALRSVGLHQPNLISKFEDAVAALGVATLQVCGAEKLYECLRSSLSPSEEMVLEESGAEVDTESGSLLHAAPTSEVAKSSLITMMNLYRDVPTSSGTTASLNMNSAETLSKILRLHFMWLPGAHQFLRIQKEQQGEEGQEEEAAAADQLARDQYFSDTEELVGAFSSLLPSDCFSLEHKGLETNVHPVTGFLAPVPGPIASTWWFSALRLLSNPSFFSSTATAISETGDGGEEALALLLAACSVPDQITQERAMSLLLALGLKSTSQTRVALVSQLLDLLEDATSKVSFLEFTHGKLMTVQRSGEQEEDVGDNTKKEKEEGLQELLANLIISQEFQGLLMSSLTVLIRSLDPSELNPGGHWIQSRWIDLLEHGENLLSSPSGLVGGTSKDEEGEDEEDDFFEVAAGGGLTLIDLERIRWVQTLTSIIPAELIPNVVRSQVSQVAIKIATAQPGPTDLRYDLLLSCTESRLFVTAGAAEDLEAPVGPEGGLPSVEVVEEVWRNRLRPLGSHPLHYLQLIHWVVGSCTTTKISGPVAGASSPRMHSLSFLSSLLSDFLALSGFLTKDHEKQLWMLVGCSILAELKKEEEASNSRSNNSRNNNSSSAGSSLGHVAPSVNTIAEKLSQLEFDRNTFVSGVSATNLLTLAETVGGHTTSATEPSPASSVLVDKENMNPMVKEAVGHYGEELQRQKNYVDHRETLQQQQQNTSSAAGDLDLLLSREILEDVQHQQHSELQQKEQEEYFKFFSTSVERLNDCFMDLLQIQQNTSGDHHGNNVSAAANSRRKRNRGVFTTDASAVSTSMDGVFQSVAHYQQGGGKVPQL